VANPRTHVYPLEFFLIISSLMIVAMAIDASFEVGKNLGEIFSISENLGNLAK
jgi:hypothetical protein